MTAGAELQEAIVSAALPITELRGVFEGPPARADFPYLVVDCGQEKDWSCKGLEGREVTVLLTLWDDQGARLLALEGALQDTALQSRDLPQWKVSSLNLTEKKKVRSAEGPWASQLTLRARLLKRTTGGGDAAN